MRTLFVFLMLCNSLLAQDFQPYYRINDYRVPNTTDMEPGTYFIFVSLDGCAPCVVLKEKLKEFDKTFYVLNGSKPNDVELCNRFLEGKQGYPQLIRYDVTPSSGDRTYWDGEQPLSKFLNPPQPVQRIDLRDCIAKITKSNDTMFNRLVLENRSLQNSFERKLAERDSRLEKLINQREDVTGILQEFKPLQNLIERNHKQLETLIKDSDADREAMAGLLRDRDNTIISAFKQRQDRLEGIFTDRESRLVGLFNDRENRLVGLFRDREQRLLDRWAQHAEDVDKSTRPIRKLLEWTPVKNLMNRFEEAANSTASMARSVLIAVITLVIVGAILLAIMSALAGVIKSLVLRLFVRDARTN